MFDCILFDLDGTLTDPGEGITNSVAYALCKQGIKVNDKKELYCFIGPPLSESFSKYYGFNHADALKCVEYYREYFRDKGMFENEVYIGVPQMLARLKDMGKRIVLATSKPEEFAKQILEHFDLIGYFDFVAGASMDESRNKKGDVIRYALESVGYPENVLMVGDRKHDILGAKENCIASLGVLYGYGDREELEESGADFIAESVEDILNFL